MLCPNCGQETPEHDTICPGCGWAPEAAPVTEETAAPEETASVTQEEIPEEPAPDTDEAAASDTAGDSEDPEGPEETEPPEDTETPEESEPRKKKQRSLLSIILGAIAGLLLIVVVCLSVVLTTLSRTGQMPGFVTSIQSFFHREHFDADAVGVQVVDSDGNTVTELTNEQLCFYYWGEFYYYIQSGGLPFDTAQPLSEQSYSEDMSWQDYFLENARASIQQVEALKAEAAASGFTMPELYQTEYETTLASMPDYAAQAGFTDKDGNGDVLSYVRDSYGSAATEKSFQQYLYDSYFVTAYSDEIYDNATVTDEELDAYYDENSEMYEMYGILRSDLPDVNVRHILVEPVETGEDASEEEIQAAKDAAETEAKRILQEWKDGDATEESFGDLANIYSTDGGSNTVGGLYEDVHPGQMVDPFNDWCFDEARKPGDTGIVETDFGFHVMYFVGTTDNYYWKQVVEGDLRYEKYDEALSAIVSGYTVEFTDKLELSTPTAVTALSTQAAG